MIKSLGYGVLINPLKESVTTLTFEVNDDLDINISDIVEALNCDTDWIYEAQQEYEELEAEGWDYLFGTDLSDAVRAETISEYNAWYEVDRDENPTWPGLINYDFKNDYDTHSRFGVVLITSEDYTLFSEEECEDFLRNVKITFGE